MRECEASAQTQGQVIPNLKSIRSMRMDLLELRLLWRWQVSLYNINQTASHQLLEMQNSSESENFFLVCPPSEGTMPLPLKEEENLMDGQCGVKIKKQVLSRKKRRFNKSLWTLQENMKYVRFLQENRELFTSTKENRRLLKINKMISQSIGTRSPDQCRSHHQKMVKYHDSIEGIINHVFLLHNIFLQDPLRMHQTEGKVPMRIRKRVNRGELQSVSIQEEGEKTLWDVLCIEEGPLPSTQHNILYL